MSEKTLPLPDEVQMCEECEGKRDVVPIVAHCDECGLWMCAQCNEEIHKKGKRATHDRVYYHTPEKGGKKKGGKEKAKDTVPIAIDQCDECEGRRGTIAITTHCAQCDQWLCDDCDKKLHAKGKRSAHERHHFDADEDGPPAFVVTCEECEEATDEVGLECLCPECEQYLCPDCNKRVHQKGKRKGHVRDYWGRAIPAHDEATKPGMKPVAKKKKEEEERPTSPKTTKGKPAPVEKEEKEEAAEDDADEVEYGPDAYNINGQLKFCRKCYGRGHDEDGCTKKITVKKKKPKRKLSPQEQEIEDVRHDIRNAVVNQKMGLPVDVPISKLRAKLADLKAKSGK
jgi:uncharacterized protein YlaI